MFVKKPFGPVVCASRFPTSLKTGCFPVIFSFIKKSPAGYSQFQHRVERIETEQAGRAKCGQTKMTS